ncbi:cytochrome P450 [Saccharothrix sp.]|uniref:cytochrome P450 family protein n=1 Tax=Saccharothrix sp. TaxID=1873460 RepID=UPI002810B298|nr:cytochrome P450 [Saccharothrix sp.]
MVFTLDPTGRDIHAEAAELRARGRLTRVGLPGGVTAWSVGGLADLKRLLGDPRLSKDPRRHWKAWQDGEIPDDWPLHLWVSVRNMFTAYGDEHRRLRALVSKAFTPRRVEDLRPWVQRIADDLLDGLDAGPEVADLREGFAYPLPIEVICRLFGVPDDVRPGLRRAVDIIFDTTVAPEVALANQQALYAMLHGLVEAKRRRPGDDLADGLIAARDEDGSRLTEQELVDTLILVLAAGHETTVNLLDHAIAALLTHPEQRRRVEAGEVRWVDVVEETLRWQAPVAHLPLRYAVEDVAVDGTVIRAGEAVLAGYAAAGRDPEHHGPTAAEFDPGRADKTHLAFGFGAHYCLGAPLARLEAEIALKGLFERFPGMVLAEGELRPLPSFISNGHVALPVRLRG